MELPSKQRKTERDAFEPLDDIDRRILETVQRDARIRIAELGRLIGLSAPAVADRLKRLEERGVLSYTASVNPRALGYTISALVRVSPLSGKVLAIPEIVKNIPEVTECFRITGDDCYIMRLYLRDMSDLEPILDQFVPYGRTTTNIVHSATLEPRPLPIT